MIRRPPRSTRTDTLVPYTTLFRSRLHPFDCGQSRVGDSPTGLPARAVHAAERLKCQLRRPKVVGRQSLQQRPCVVREARQPRLWVVSKWSLRLPIGIVVQCKPWASPVHRRAPMDFYTIIATGSEIGRAPV